MESMRCGSSSHSPGLTHSLGVPLGTLLPLLSVMVVLNLVYVGSLLAAVFSSARTDVVSHLGLVVATYPYATLVSLANLAAMFLILRKGARLWLKTEKTGYVDEQIRPSSF